LLNYDISVALQGGDAQNTACARCALRCRRGETARGAPAASGGVEGTDARLLNNKRHVVRSSRDEVRTWL